MDGGPVVVEQLTADERPRVVLAQVEVAQLRPRLSPAAASFARFGSRSGPKMKRAPRARTTISPQPIESNTAPPPCVAAARDRFPA
jgi:hypothetical protein